MKNQKPQNNAFKERCLLGLDEPEQLEGFCPHGLARAQWYSDNPGSSASEEQAAPGCFVPGTLVKTLFGFKPIEEILPGDKVWTHKGRFRKVKYVTNRQYDGIVYKWIGGNSIESNTLFDSPCWMTGDHLVYTPFNTTEWQKSESLFEIFDECAENIPSFAAAKPVVCDIPFRLPFTLERFEAYKEDILWLCGLWLNRGRVSENDFFTISVNRLMVNKVDEKLRRLLTIMNGWVEIETEDEYIVFICHHKVLNSWFKNHFGGSYSSKRQKCVPKEFWLIPVSEFEQVYQGMTDAIYLRDGGSLSRFFTDSNKLAAWLHTMQGNKGIYRPLPKRGMGDLDTYVLDMQEDKDKWYVDMGSYFMFKPTWCMRRNYSGKVYDLTVEDDASFDVGFIVHNCNYSVISEDEDGYCFYKMMKNKEGRTFSDEEIAIRLGLTSSQVRTIYTRALAKLQNTETIKEIDELRKAGCLFDQPEADDDIYYPDVVSDSADGGYCEEVEDTGGGTSKRRGRPRMSGKLAIVNPDA